MGQSKTSKKSGGGAKIGRNKEKCTRYRQENRRAKNKARRIRKLYGAEAATEYLKNYKPAARQLGKVAKPALGELFRPGKPKA